MRKSRKLLVAIDLGNTSATFAFFRDRTLIHHNYISNCSVPQIIRSIERRGRKYTDIHLIVSSVVPLLLRTFKRKMKKSKLNHKIYVVGQDVALKVPMKYRSRELGSDRLVNVYGALHRCELPCLVIDFGTAVTFDVISKKGVFEGGLIVPGLDVSEEALQDSAAMLPKLRRLKKVKRLVGRSTREAMSSGLLNGFGALADGLIGRVRAQYGRRLHVLATGGFAREIGRYSREIRRADPLHTIRSLGLIYWNEVVPRL